MTIDLNQLRYYAEWLLDVLAEDVSRLGDSGVPIRHSACLEVGARAFHPEGERARRSNGLSGPSGMGEPDRNGAREVIGLLEKWARQDNESRQPLLILGAFGTGKSAALASFSVRLAEQLLDQLDSGQGDRLLIPIPVRLRALLGFTPDSTKPRPFLQFMHHSLQVLDPESDNPLDWETFQELSQRRLLLPLFDGFDELPGPHGSAAEVDRVNVLRRIKRSSDGFFVLTSRPGYEVESVIGRADQHVLEELTDEQVTAFIDGYFANDRQRHAAAKKAIRDRQSHSASWLRRPLFLATWCELAPRDGSPPPDTTDALMTELVVCALGKTRGAINENRADILETLENLGALLATFADRGFSESTDVTALNRSLSDHPTLRRQTELEQPGARAVRPGFLVRHGETLWYALKTPVVEYLIGRHMAELFAGEKQDQRLLLERFRRWVWQPALYESLDFMFEALWSDGTVQRDWAQTLLSWVMETTRHDLTSSRPLEPYLPDDILNPLAILALRWHGLDARCEGISDAGRTATQDACFALARIKDFGITDARILQGPPMSRDVLLALVDTLISIHVHSFGVGRTIWQDVWLSYVVSAATLRVPHDSAAEVFDECVCRLRASGIGSSHLWLAVLHGIAERLPAHTAGDRVIHLISCCRDIGEATPYTPEWADPIYAAARRINGMEAARYVRLFLETHNEAEVSFLGLWRAAILGAIDRLPGADAAAELLPSLIYCRLGTDKSGFCRLYLHHAIWAAVAKITPNDAARFIRDWIAAVGERERIARVRTQEHPGGQGDGENNRDLNSMDPYYPVLLYAIQKAAERVSSSDAGDLLRLLCQAQKTHRHDEAKTALQKAIASVMGRITQDEAVAYLKGAMDHREAIDGIALCSAAQQIDGCAAPSLVEDLVRNRDAAIDKRYWGNAIYFVATRMGKEFAGQAVTDWIRQYDRADGIEKDGWERAIEGGAFASGEDDAEQILGQLLKRLDNSQWDSRLAIGYVVSSLSSTAALKWLKELGRRRDLASDLAEKQEWQRFIGKLAGRVPAHEAGRLVNEVILQIDPELCERDKVGFQCLVERVAERAADNRGEDVDEWVKAYNSSDKNVKEMWHSAILGVAASLDEGQLVRICNDLINNGSWDLAMQAAYRSANVAISAYPADDKIGKAVVKVGGRRITYVARLRKEMTLDEELVAAPESIKRILLDEVAGCGSADSAAAPEEVRWGESGKESESCEVDSQGSFIFRRGNADTWILAFDSEPQVIGSKHKGFEYVARLLSKPNTRISPLEITMATAPDGFQQAAEREAVAEVADEEAVRAWVKRQTELRKQLEVADDPLLEREFREIQKYLRRARRPGRQSANLNQPRMKKAYTSIRNAIDRAVKKMALSGAAGLAAHLNEFIRPDDYHLVYRPDDAPDWDVSWLSPADRDRR